MNGILPALIVSFFVGIIVAPPVIILIRKLKAGQTILSYVSQHKDKEGIPTMGGIIFLVSALISCLIFWKGNGRLATVALLVVFSYGIVGGLDDFIKVFFKRNLGLKAYQKIISQTVIAVLATIFAYRNQYVGSEILIPIINYTIELHWAYIPLSFLVYIATTNCVNLTDGLDGLAGSTVIVYLGFFGILLYEGYLTQVDSGNTLYASELYNLTILVASFIGGLAAFLWFNSYKARVFMGDTGSLALGALCAVIPLFTKNPLLILLVGIMFVVSGISVILQVLVFKLRKKRIFLMAPLHHHLEMKGYNESKIVTFYSVITAIAGTVALLIV